jgi:iron-sulfur cluster assembly protein
MITVSEKAQKRISDLIKEENLSDNHFLRVGVKGGGCSGLSYDLGFDDTLQEGDQKFEDNGVTIVCDKRSFLYLFGT